MQSSMVLHRALLWTYFDTDVPFIITGRIVDTNEDMIEIKPMNNGITDHIFLDFHYGGLDKNFKIKNIIIRENISLPNQNEIQDSDAENDEEFVIPQEDQQTNIQEGEVVGYVSKIVNDKKKEESTYISDVDQQTNDYISSLLHGKERLTEKEKRRALKDIQKYKQMRKQFSIFTDEVTRRKLSQNQIVEKNSKLMNSHIIYPVTSNLYQQFYISPEEVNRMKLPKHIYHKFNTENQLSGENVIVDAYSSLEDSINEINILIDDKRKSQYIDFMTYRPNI